MATRDSTTPKRDVRRITIATGASRVAGLLRNFAVAAALGVATVSDIYNTANNVPGVIFLLLGGGTLAAVFVPRLVEANAQGVRDGNELASIILVSAGVFGLVVSGVALWAALEWASSGSHSGWTASDRQLFSVLAWWCMPQVFFLAFYAAASQVLNAKRRFGAVSWAPGLVSATVIGGCLALALGADIEPDESGSVAPWAVTTLGGMTLLGAVLQASVCCWTLTKSGYRLAWPSSLRGLGLRGAFTAGWRSLIAGAIYNGVLLSVAWIVPATGLSAEGGYTAFLYATTVLFTASSVLASGYSTVLLERLSRSFIDGSDAVRSRYVESSLIGALRYCAPVSTLICATGVMGASAVFGMAGRGAESALLIGIMISILGCGLIPYALHSIMIRAFYARRDATTPLVSAGRIGAISLVGFVIAVAIGSSTTLLPIMGAAFAVAYWIDLPIKLRALVRRGLITTNVVRDLVIRSSLGACIPAAMLATASVWLEAEFGALGQLAIAVGVGVLALGAYGLTIARSPIDLRSLAGRSSEQTP